MRKITFLTIFAFLLLLVPLNAQVLNQSANWPNANWTVTGTYDTDPDAFEADPTSSPNFAFDDDDAGTGSSDDIAAESPVIDLTDAFNAGETFLSISANYVYNNNTDDAIVIQYWDADASSWADWQVLLTDTANPVQNEFCSGDYQLLVSDALDISGFTSTQLSGFAYRIYFDDDYSGSGGYEWGFCFQSPTISSLSNSDIVLDWNNLQWPPDGTIEQGQSLTVYAQAYKGGVTDASSDMPGDGVEAWIGYNTADTDPGSDGDWVWVLATYNVDAGNNDEFMANIGLGFDVGTYYYASRFRLNGGDYTYGGYSAGGGGFWDGSTNVSGVLTVTEATPPSNDECDSAIELTVNVDYDCGVVTSGTTVAATESSQDDDVTGTPNNDVWFSFVATTVEHRVSIQNKVAIIGTSVDMGIGVYDGTNGCEALALVDDSDPDTLDLEGLTPGVTYLVRVYGYNSSNPSAQVNFDICVGTPPCIAGEANTTVIPDCDNGEFSIEVEVTDQQDITDLTDGTATISVTGEGTYVFGPYSHGTEVTIEALHIDEYCNFDIDDDITYYCPPANDECDNAIELTVNADLACGVVTSGTTAAATASSQADDVTGTPNTDVWFSFVATYPAHQIILSNVENLGGGTSTSTDMGMAVYDATGGCDALVLVDDSDPNTLILEELTVGVTYLVRVYGWQTSIQYNNFDICLGTLPCLEGETAGGIVVPDCDNTEFSIEIEVTEQGSITDLTDGTNTIEVTTEGTYTFGPYASGTIVIIEAVHTDDYCNFEVGEFYYMCPETVVCGNVLSETYCYGNNEFQVFSYTSSDGVTPLLIEFSQGTVEYDSWWGDTLDDLVIYDGSDESGDVLFDSDVDGEDLTGLSLLATSGSIYMEFDSDGGVSCSDGDETSWAFEVSCFSCTPAEVIAGVIPDCDSDEFYVEIAIEAGNFGDLETLTDGTQSETVNTSQQLYIFGPYASGTEVTITAEHSDEACDFEVETFDYTCPIPGQICETAIVVGELPYMVSDDTANYLNDYDNGSSSCSSYYMSGDDVVYSFTPEADDNYTVSLTNLGSTWSGIHILDGCPDSGASCVAFEGDSGSSDRVIEVDLVAGTTYYIIISTWATPQSTTYTLTIDAETLSTQDLSAQDMFSYYPNPVENTLNIKSQQTIERVEVYNMLGQMVVTNTPNNLNHSLDMSSLTTGSYFVKVSIGGVIETIRIIKK